MSVPGKRKTSSRRGETRLKYHVPLTAVEARTVKFKTKRWGSSLDIRSVDSLMREVSEAIDPASDDEHRLSSVQLVEALDSLKTARWWQKGYDPVDVFSFGMAALETARSLESYAVVSQAESILAVASTGSAGADDGTGTGGSASGLDAKVTALANGLIALGDLTKSRIDDLERELEDLRRQVTGRLH